MKKHLLRIFLLLGFTLPNQTMWCMDNQEQSQTTVAVQPSLKTRLLSMTCNAKNWVISHKKPLLIGSMVLASITAYVLYTYIGQATPPATQEAATALGNIVTQPSVIPAIAPFNVTAHQYMQPPIINPQQLLEVAENCAYPPAHCWVDPKKVMSNCLPFTREGKAYDCSRAGCSHKDLRSLGAMYQSCYDNVLHYARQHGLESLKKVADAALKKAKGFWDVIDFYGASNEWILAAAQRIKLAGNISLTAIKATP